MPRKATAKAEPKKVRVPEAASYGAKDITVNEGLDVVRANPQVFVNSTDTFAIYICVKEPIDNAKDEARIGHGDHVIVIYDKAKDMVYVCDQGRGIPVDIHPKTKLSVLETVLTRLSAGGKMQKDGAYKKATAGVHGMGVSITNALSDHMQAWTCPDGKTWYTQTYARGKTTSKLTKTTAPKLPFKVKHPDKGTVIAFKIDYTMFDKGSVIDEEMIKRYLHLSAYLMPTVTFEYVTKDGKVKYKEPKGLVARVKSLLEEKKADASGRLFHHHDEANDITAVVQWSTYEEEYIESYVNGTNTREGGKHVDGFFKAIGDALTPFKKKSHKFRVEDLRAGAIGVLTASVKHPRFTTQVKDKLASPEAAEMVYKATLPALKQFFDGNKTLARAIIKRAVAYRNIMETAKASKADAAKLKVEVKGRVTLPAKLAVATKKNPTKNELFLVEGDSAGGTAKQARDSTFQEVLPLRGKPQNVYKTKNPLSNREIQDIIKSIGYDSSLKNPLSKVRVARVILLTDPDPDGAHIDTLLLAALNRQAPMLFEKGMVFTVENNLFMYQDGANKIFGADINEVKKKLGKKKFDPSNFTRIKGWGEIGPDIIGPVAFDYDSRRLRRITPLDHKKKGDEAKFMGVVGEDTKFRKNLMGITK